jgi:hypothetical protein
MRKIFALALLLLVAIAVHAQNLTTVRDTIYSSGGNLASGNIVITWPPFKAADGTTVFGGFRSFSITSGALAVALVPNAGSDPSGTSYKIDYRPSGVTPFTEYWVVPTSSPLSSPGAPSVTPQGTTGSTTYCYWVSAINATGETLLGPRTCISNGNASLNGTDYNQVDWGDVASATGYRVYRTSSATAPSGTCPGGAHPACGLVGTPSVSNIDDQSSSTSSSVIPFVNDTDPKLVSDVRVTQAPSVSVIFDPTQIVGTAVVQGPLDTQTITAPASSGKIPLVLKGNATAAADVLDVYDSAGTPVKQSFFDSNAALNTAKQITSTLTTGTAPLSITSTTKVANLNVDQLDSGDWAAPGAIGTTTPTTGKFTTVESTVTTGTAPLIAASTTKVTNLNVDQVDGADWAAPAAIGTGTPAAITGTTIVANSTLTATGGMVATGRNRYCTVPVGFTAYGSFGTNTTPVDGTTYYADVFIPRNVTLTGVSILNGTVAGTNNWIVGLHTTAGGATVANSNLSGTLSSGTDAFQDVAFTSTYNAVGPARYWIVFQTNGATDRFRTVAASTFVDVLTKSATGSFGTLPSLTPPTTFTADVGLIACVY